MLGYSYTLSAHVSLDNPVGGETYTVGQTVTIQWHITIPHNTLNWDILFSPDGGATWTYIYQDLPVGNSSYQWVVPSTITTQARVSVIQDNDGMDYQDESNNFTIQAAPVPPAIVLGATAIVIESNTSTQDAAIQAWLDNHGGASANNFCGTLSWTDDYTTLSNECGATGSALVTFTAADQCGSTSTSATLTVVDSYPPVLGVPASDLAVECNGNGNTGELNSWLGNAANAMAADDGSNVTWTNAYPGLSNGCGLTGSTTVIFTATDACGNSLTTSATFTIADHLAPNVSVAAQGTTILCGQPGTQADVQNWLNNHGGAIANDECGSVSWTNNFPALPDTCSHTTSWPVTFTASDECGNTSTTSAALTLLGTSGTSGPASADFAFTISPNPAHQILKVEFDQNITFPVRLTLFDAFGHMVLSENENAGAIVIPVSGYPPGIYFLRAETDRAIFTRKLLIE